MFLIVPEGFRRCEDYILAGREADQGTAFINLLHDAGGSAIDTAPGYLVTHLEVFVYLAHISISRVLVSLPDQPRLRSSPISASSLIAAMPTLSGV